MDRREPESVAAKAMNWTARITSIGLEFALPPVLGQWLDSRFGTRPWLALSFAVFGFVAGMTHTIAIAKTAVKPPDPPR